MKDWDDFFVASDEDTVHQFLQLAPDADAKHGDEANGGGNGSLHQEDLLA